MPINIDLNDPLTNAGLAITGGASIGGSIWIDKLIDQHKKGLALWDKSTQRLYNLPTYKSKLTGRWLQVSPENADKLLNNYVSNAQRLSSKKLIGSLTSGHILNESRIIPRDFRNLFENDKVDTKHLRDYYRPFTNANATKEELKNHALKTFRERNSGFLEGWQNEQMRSAYNNLSDEAKAILAESDSISSKYKKLSALADKAGLNYVEDFILGSSNVHPGAAKAIGGGVTGVIDPKTGKYSQEVLHSGMARPFIKDLKMPLSVMNTTNKLMMGAKGATAAVGLYGLGRLLGEELNKSASADDLIERLQDINSDDTLLGIAETGVGGAAASVSGSALIERLKQLAEDSKKAPNLNVGFSYGNVPKIGEGHKSPSNHIRQILERYIESLPEGHPLKGEVILGADGKPVLNELGFAKRKGGVQFHDIAQLNHGVSPSVAKNYNIIYNTGLGGAVNHPGMDHKWISIGEYANNSKRLKGTAQTIKNYATDTPKLVDQAFGPFTIKVPNYGSPVSGPGWAFNIKMQDILPENFPWREYYGHGYYGANQDVIAYGKIPDEIARRTFRPLISGEFKNMAPDIIGTPFISPATLDTMNKYTTREQKINRIKELIDAWDPADTSGTKDKVSRIYNALKDGRRVVSIAGSGRGDYVGERTAHLLDSLDRFGVDDVEVLSLMGGYTGAKDLSNADRLKLINNLAAADKKGRVTAVGRLENELYTLLQQVSDINLATTGQMGVSEAANAGNLQFIPERWNDLNQEPMKRYQTRAWSDILTNRGKNPTNVNYAHIFDGSTPQLDVWNGGTLKYFPEQMPDVFKRLNSYEGDVRAGAAEYLRNWGLSDEAIKLNPQRIDTDPVAELLLDKNKGKLADMSRKAFEAASANRAKLPAAQEALVKDFTETLNNNITRQKLRAVPGAIGHGLVAGLGVYGVADGINRIMNPSNYKFNLSL